MAENVEIKIIAKGIADANQKLKSLGTAFNKVKTRAQSVDRSLSKLKGSFVGLKAAIAVAATGLILKKVSGSVIETAASFEQLELKLNALTKGKGAETLERINKWALDMPVDTKKAVDTFALMQAFGLDPTIEKMETLVDVATIFGEDAMPRIARALGQMAALGKVSAEELNQLSEVGINSRKILQDTFGLTVEELQKQNIEVDKVIDALMAGMGDQFGGAARAGMTAWQGLKASFKSYITEIERQVADAGVFGALKQQLGAINNNLKEWLANNTDLIKQKVPEYIEKVKAVSASLASVFKVLIQDIASVGKFIFQLPIGLKLAAAAALLLSTSMGPILLAALGIEAAIKTFPVIWNLAVEANSRAVLLMLQGVNKVINAVNKIPGIKIGKIDTSGQEAIVDHYTNIAIESEKALEANQTLVQSFIDSGKKIKKALGSSKATNFDDSPASPVSPLPVTSGKAKAEGKKSVEEWRKAMNDFKIVTDAQMKEAALNALKNFQTIENSGQLTGKRLAEVWSGQVAPDLTNVFDTLDTETQNMVLANNKRFETMASKGVDEMNRLETGTRDVLTRMRGPFTEFFMNMNQGWSNVQNLVVNVVGVIKRKLAELAADRAIKYLTSVLTGGIGGGGGGFFSGLLGGLFGKRPHGGGQPGSLPTQKILTLHTGGLAGDETLAKLKKKEFVLNEGVTKSLGVDRLNRINGGDFTDFQSGGSGGSITVLAPVTLNAIDVQSGIAFLSKPENLEVFEGFLRQAMVNGAAKHMGL